MENKHDDLAASSPSRDESRTSKRKAAAQEPDSTEAGQPSLPEDEEIVRRRAYEIYLSRDGAAGDQDDDWLTAEREIRGGRAQNDSPESQREPREEQR